MKKHLFKTSIYSLFLLGAILVGHTSFLSAQNSTEITQYPGYELVWSDEFDVDGEPDSKIWGGETGFKRNEELQWYQWKNAEVANGVLKLIGKKERVKNPNYVAGSSDWKKNREYAEYTAPSITTGKSKAWIFGRYEVRGKIPTARGSWPAIWLLGIDKDWPKNGEIDVMEFYLKGGSPHIMANAAWGAPTGGWDATWDGSSHAFSDFTAIDPNWADKFHLWRMDWDKDYIRIYLDDRLLNEIDLSRTINPDGFNPFHQPQYLLLNLALGGNGGTPDNSKFPLVYEVDFARVYQKIIPYERSVKNVEDGKKYYIKHISNYYLTEKDGDTSFIIDTPTGNENQQFEFSPVPDQENKYYIQLVSNGHYLYNKDGYLYHIESLDELATIRDAIFEVDPVEDEKYVRIRPRGWHIGNAEYETGTTIQSNRIGPAHRANFWELLLCTSEVGKIALMNQINDVKTFLSTAINGTAPGQYPTAEFEALIEALTQAEAINAKADATQDEVDTQVSQLGDALSACKSSMILLTSDPDQIYNIVHYSKNYLDSKEGGKAGVADPSGDNNQNFKFVSTGNGEYNILQVGTNKYLGVNSNGWDTQWDNNASSKFRLDTEVGNIIRIKYTGNSKFLGTDETASGSTVFYDKDGNNEKHYWTIKLDGTLDFSDLDFAISKAILYKSLTLLIGEESNQCPQETYDTFIQKIEEAQALDRDQMSASDIALETSNMNEAIDTFIAVLTSKLAESINTADELYSAAEVGNNKGQYPSDAKTTFGRVLSLVKSTLENPASYQSDYNESTERLIDAIEVFRNSVNTEDGEDPDSITEVDNLGVTIYTSGSALYINDLFGTNNISIYNSVGTLMYTESTNSAEFSKNLQEGLYIISITGDVNHNQKAIVK